MSSLGWLQTNFNKIEAMIILSNKMSTHSPFLSVIWDPDVLLVSYVKNLGVTLDSNLSTSQHISNACKSAHIQIRHVFHMTSSHHSSNPNYCMPSCPLSDYYNSLLSGCPQYLLYKLQNVQNAAARLVSKAKKSDYIHPIFETLHWHSIQNISGLL